MVPSRQLGIQILRAAHALLPAELHPFVQQCIGGASQTRQLQALRSKHRPFLVVGTPGRLLELAGEEALKLWQCPLLVLDEVRKSESGFLGTGRSPVCCFHSLVCHFQWLLRDCLLLVLTPLS